MSESKNFYEQIDALIKQKYENNSDALREAIQSIATEREAKSRIVIQEPIREEIPQYPMYARGRRKITTEIVTAFLQKRSKRLGNTETDGRVLYLHGNAIARWSDSGHIEIRSAGWETTTTKERLNALPNVSIYQKNWEWHLNGQPWNNTREWTRV